MSQAEETVPVNDVDSVPATEAAPGVEAPTTRKWAARAVSGTGAALGRAAAMLSKASASLEALATRLAPPALDSDGPRLSEVPPAESSPG